MIIGPRVRIRVILNQILSERDTQTLCFLTISNESPCVPHLRICCRHAQPIPSKARRKVNAMISGLVWDLRPCLSGPLRVENQHYSSNMKERFIQIQRSKTLIAWT